MPQISRQWDGLPLNIAIMALLPWQLLATIVFLCGFVFLFWFTKCFKFCSPLVPSDSFYLIIIFLNLALLLAIWYELLLWGRQALTIEKFLNYQLAKCAYVMPLYVIWQCLVIRDASPGKLWKAVWEALWIPVVFVVPYFATLVIVMVAWLKERRELSGETEREVSDEETPLLAGD